MMEIVIGCYLNYKHSNQSMNRKQSHETTSQGYGQGTYKVTYQVNSPYIEMLESKKKVYGHRYDHKPNRSFNHPGPSYVKASPASITSMFPQGSKSIKASSTEKSKYGRTSTNEKKKRTKTEATEDKMHESLFVYPSMIKNNEDLASKSLHYADRKVPEPEFQPNPYFQELSAKKNKRKRHLSENKYSNSLLEEKNQTLSLGLGALESLQIQDIDGLISLIDNCVQEANEYIAYLSEKMDSLKEQLMATRTVLAEKDSQIQKKEAIIISKDLQIQHLEKEISELKNRHPLEAGFQVKNLLQVMEKMNQENQRLREELSKSRQELTRGRLEDPNRVDRVGKDYHNEIHSKIDILNISIDSNSPGAKERKDLSKKYKFIKPKGGR